MVNLRTTAMAVILGVAAVPAAEAASPGLLGGTAGPAIERAGSATPVHHHPQHMGGYGAEESGVCLDGRLVHPDWGCWTVPPATVGRTVIVPWRRVVPAYPPPPSYYDPPSVVHVPPVNPYDPPTVIEVRPTAPPTYYSPYR